MRRAVILISGIAVAALLQGCLATTVAGAAIGVTGAAVGATAKGVGAVGRAVIPGGGDDDNKDKR
jgi:hypothetical protein